MQSVRQNQPQPGNGVCGGYITTSARGAATKDEHEERDKPQPKQDQIGDGE